MPLRPHRSRIAAAAAAAIAVCASMVASHPSVAGSSTRTLIWSDEFNGAYHALPGSQWEIETGGAWGDHELQSYTARPYNVRLNGAGELQIVARRESFTGADGIHRNYTSARIMGRHAFRYGYLVANLKFPKGQGLWPAFWTLGSDIRGGVRWPYCGEIDVMESINSMSYFSGHVHGPDARTGRAYGVGRSRSLPSGATASWHQYGIYWTSSAITWYFDQRPIGTVRRANLPASYRWVFDKPHVALLNLAVGGDYPGPPSSSTPFPAVLTVASVRLFNHP